MNDDNIYYKVSCEMCETPGKTANHFDRQTLGNHNRWYYGSVYFTRREIQTLSLYLRGCRSKEIAHILNIADKTVDTHLRKIKDKILAENRHQIVQRAMELGFIELMFQKVI